MSKIIIFPTDTVYGIGCGIYDDAARKRIYEIKHRPLDKPLPVLCANIKQIEKIVEVNSLALKLIKNFLPGPLTIIMKALPDIAAKTGYKTLGVRIPNSEVALKILHDNGPMFTTSVNESGETPLNTYEEIREKYASLVEEIVPAEGVFSSNIASTVVNCTNNMLEVIRVGEISLSELIKKV